MPELPSPVVSKRDAKHLQSVFGAALVLVLITLTFSAGYIALVFAGFVTPRWPSLIPGTGAQSEFTSLPVDLVNRTVYVEVAYVSYGTLMPWIKLPYSSSPAVKGIQRSLSPGFVLDPTKKLILVSDVVARDAAEMYVIGHEDAQPFDAEVVLMAEDAHVALIRVNDENFWKAFDGSMKALDFSTELPAVSTLVQMAGHYSGDKAVAVQTGSVSELQFGIGSEGVSLGRNAGSGSFYAKVHPEPSEEFVAGPVFSLTNPSGPLLGFMALGVGKANFIPGPLVHRVLQEYYTSGKWGGLVSMGLQFRDMQAQPMRKFWRLEDSVGGVMIRSVAPTSAVAHAGVRKGDVVIAIDGKPVHQDGTIAVRVGDHESNFPLGAAVSAKTAGDMVKLQLLRPSSADARTGAEKPPKAFEVNLKLSPPDPLIRKLSGKGLKPGQGKAPSFFAVGNLIFTTVTQDLLQDLGDHGLPQETRVQIIQRWRNDPKEEVVLFLRGFEDDCNAHYPLKTPRVLTHFNGKTIQNLPDLLQQVGEVTTKFVKSVAAGGETLSIGTGCDNDSGFLEFTFLPDANKDTGGAITGDPDIVLLTACAQEHSPRGMVTWISRYGSVPFSPDLAGTYSEAMLGGTPIQDLLGGEAAATALLGPGFFHDSQAANKGKEEAQAAKNFSFKGSLLEQTEADDCAIHVPKSGSGSRQDPPVPTTDRRLLEAFVDEGTGADTVGPPLVEQQAKSADVQKPLKQNPIAAPIQSHMYPTKRQLKSNALHSRARETQGGVLGTEGKNGDPTLQADANGPQHKESHLKPILPMKNVVKIMSVNREPSFTEPWIPEGQTGARCTGIIMDVKRRFILTCAHCVGDSEMLFVTREDFPKDTVARVVEVAHDLDLAWLTADNSDGFWDHVDVQSQPISSELPGYGSEVQVVGYPIGGTAITQTAGVISRVDSQVYPNGLDASYRNAPSSLLVLQVDAAINGGNSGGPAFSASGELVGIAFAGLNGAQNVGYVIPNTIVRNFVEAVVHGGQQWVAQSELGVRLKAMQNPSLRAYWGLGAADHGIQLRTVAPGSNLAAAGVRKTDILVSVDGMNVTDIGEVSYPGGHDNFLVDLDVIISQKQRSVSGGETTLMDGQAIGPSELIGVKNVKIGSSPPSGGAHDSQANMLISSSGQGGNGGGSGASSWNLPNQVQHPLTNLVFLRRDCENGKAKLSRVPASINVGPIAPLVPRFNDKAVGLAEDTIGKRKAAEMGFAAAPTYFEVGGLVWTVLSQPLLNQLKAVPQSTSLCLYRWKRAVAEESPEHREFGGCGAETHEVVVLLKGLDHSLNQHYEKTPLRVLRYFNDEPVVSLARLIEQVGKAVKSQSPYMSFTFESMSDGKDLAGGRGDPDIVLNTKDVIKAANTGEILRAYGLKSPVSDDLHATYIQSM